LREYRTEGIYLKRVYPQLKKTLYLIKVATDVAIENIIKILSEYSKKHFTIKFSYVNIHTRRS